MSFWKHGLHATVMPDIVPLEPPATQTELQWWRGRRDAYKRKMLLRMGLPMFGVGILTMLITKPVKFFTLSGLGTACALLLLALFATLMHVRTQEKGERDQAIRWKRIREDLDVERRT